MRSNPARLRTASVSRDWGTPLPSTKSVAYLRTSDKLETAYGMFSVNLDEALGLRRCGRLPKLISY